MGKINDRLLTQKLEKGNKMNKTRWAEAEAARNQWEEVFLETSLSISLSRA